MLHHHPPPDERAVLKQSTVTPSNSSITPLNFVPGPKVSLTLARAASLSSIWKLISPDCLYRAMGLISSLMVLDVFVATVRMVAIAIAPESALKLSRK